MQQTGHGPAIDTGARTAYSLAGRKPERKTVKRITMIVTALILTAAVFCGKSTPQAAPKAATGTLPAEAFQPLTDDEMGKFKKALPLVATALESAGYKTTLPGDSDALPVAFTKLIDPIGGVKGVTEALTAAGTNWQEFRATHFKLSATSAAMGLDMALQQKEMWSKDTSAAAKQYAKRVEEMQKYLTGVPDANKQQLQKYGPELQDMGRLIRQ